LYFGLTAYQSAGQILVQNQQIEIVFDSITQKLHIKQKCDIVNKTSSKIDSIYFYAWANAYKNKKTVLAKRFIENYDLKFHFTRKKNRGYIDINKIEIDRQGSLPYTFLKNQVDILKINLKKSIKAKEQFSIKFDYYLYLPHSKFTGFGIDKKNNILLQYFYFTPVLPGRFYSHKNLDDLPEKPTNFKIKLTNFPRESKVISNLNDNQNILEATKTTNPVIYIGTKNFFEHKSNQVDLHIFDNHSKISATEKTKRINKIMTYIRQNFGEFSQNNIIISEKDLKNNKVYGLNLLPKFINPFPKELVWEMKILHQISIKFAEKIQIDKRKYPWIVQGISAYIEYQYYKTYHPDLKLFGRVSNWKLMQFYYASQVNLTEKYPWIYLYMARMNKDQRLNKSLDSLSNLNLSVANPYKSALGFVMLKDEMKSGEFEQKLKYFYNYGVKSEVNDSIFFKIFDINNQHQWYKKYINSRAKYDYKISKHHKTEDSIYVKIIQKEKNAIPTKIYGLRNDTIVWQKQFSAITNDTIIGAPTKLDIIGLNYFNNYPELQTYNNYIRTKSWAGLNKALQIRLYQDFDNPMKNQLFINPYIEYNYYDGIQIGGQIMNESALHNHLFYSISPVFGTKSKQITGSFGVSYHQYFENFKPYALLYGFNTRYYHYDHDLKYTRINPYFVIKNRNKHIRKRQGSNILLQYLSVDKEVKTVKTEADSYQVFNIKYSYFDVNVIKDLFYSTDLQFSDKFGKLSTKLRYRFLSNKNRQWDFRIYAGYFLYNHTQSDYFSFALDRPTDYLFQYNYYGRSESSGIFHQQFIWAEGGFKTFFDDQFANEFLISNNINIGIWKWFNLYGDIALKKNKAEKAKFYYDTGLRINLVQDYFEVFFPVYSSLGNELKQTDYHQKIRLVFSINLEELFDMFKRGWY
jgi:hypothetical protein